MGLSKFIIVFSHLPIFISAVYALLVYPKLKYELRIFSWFLFLSGILQLTSLYMWIKGMNNLPILHVYVAMSFVCLAWFYNTLLSGFINKNVIWVCALLFLVFTVINSVYVQKIHTFNSYALTVECILIVILSLSTYMLLLNEIVVEKRKNEIKSLNWINSGLFIYYTSTLLIFYFGDIITHKLSQSLSRYTWILHSFFSIVMYCCFFVGLWKRPKA